MKRPKESQMSDEKQLFAYQFPIDSFKKDDTEKSYSEYQDEYWVNHAPHNIFKISNETKNKAKDVYEVYPDVVSSLEDVKDGSSVYVVWAEWTYGDSLRMSYFGSVETFGIFKDVDSAIELSEWLASLEDDNGSFTTSDGQEFNIDYVPWNGYFDRLEKVNVDIVLVKEI
jgi:hypothetical protein